MKPLLVINGRPRLYKHFEMHVCAAEVPPTSWYRISKPTGEYYTLVWFRDGSRAIVHGNWRVEQRPSGRQVIYLDGPVY